MVESKRDEVAADMAEDSFFELFVAEQLVWEHDLSWEELETGITGGGNDGGMDAIYAFGNDVLLDEGSDCQTSKTSASFELIIIQAKRSPSFTETAVDKIRDSLLRLLDLNQPLEDASTLYNSETIGWFRRFRGCYLKNANRFPTVKISIYYGSRGFDVNPKVVQKARELEVALASLFSECTCEFSFVTPSDLVALARRQRPTTLDLRFTETIATSDGAYVGLALITDYADFMSTSQGGLRTAIFESNVRDYEGSTGVNASIRKTLDEDVEDDFWWLNNGITIVASRAAQYAKTLTLEYPQIVNGLQTSREIHSYITRYKSSGNPDPQDQRSILIRVVVPPDESSRDRIIRATNSQTAIPSVALRATERIQRDIEDYFIRQGWFYERRKNRYQNEGKPIAKIITIPYLAESVSALILREPHLGGPRLGGRFLRDEKLYKSIFNDIIPLANYLKCAQICRHVELHVRKGRRRSSGGPGLRYLFHTAMAITIEITAGSQLADLDVSSLTGPAIDSWYQRIANMDADNRRQRKPKPETLESMLTDEILRQLAGANVIGTDGQG